MNEAWKNIFERFIDSYKAIQTLQENGLMDEEEKAVYEHNLLSEIIFTMKTEVDD